MAARYSSLRRADLEGRVQRIQAVLAVRRQRALRRAAETSLAVPPHSSLKAIAQPRDVH